MLQAGRRPDEVNDIFPSSRQRERYKIRSLQLSKENLEEKENLVVGPGWGLIPRLTGQLTVGHNVTLTLVFGSQLVQLMSCCQVTASEDTKP
jgi:hypothetical protein